jgi:hypothetical protein
LYSIYAKHNQKPLERISTMSIRSRLHRLASGRTILILLGLYLLFTFVVFAPLIQQIKALSGGIGMIDTEYTYTPEKAFQMVAAYGEQGRLLYAAATLTADLLYPVVYSLFLSLLILFTFGRIFSPGSPLQGLVYLPFLAALADYLENASVVTLLASFPHQPLLVAQAANLFTGLKWGLLLVSLVLALAGLLGWLIKRQNTPKTTSTKSRKKAHESSGHWIRNGRAHRRGHPCPGRAQRHRV